MAQLIRICGFFTIVVILGSVGVALNRLTKFDGELVNTLGKLRQNSKRADILKSYQKNIAIDDRRFNIKVTTVPQLDGKRMIFNPEDNICNIKWALDIDPYAKSKKFKIFYSAGKSCPFTLDERNYLQALLVERIHNIADFSQIGLIELDTMRGLPVGKEAHLQSLVRYIKSLFGVDIRLISVENDKFKFEVLL